MTINYGKREAGGLTASNPGDTLYIPFASYNDSGDSEALSGLAVTDIEIFKNGDVTPRATDSGYSILTDTGMYGNRPGLYRFRIQLFNTADDTGFFDRGSQYHVAIDSITVDGKTVRFFPAVFEIDRARVNVMEIGTDTGAANWLKQTYASGFADTGIQNRLDKIQSDTDTGIQSSVHVTSFSDTGINERLARIQSDTDTGLRTHIDDLDTGLANLAVNVVQIRGDTGGADRFYRYTQKLDTGGDATVSASLDTGLVNRAVWDAQKSAHVDTGTFGEHLGGSFGVATVDTGVVNQAVWQTNAQRKLTVDTGIADQVWMQAKASYTADTGTFGEHLGGSLGGSSSVDTGQINQAVWQGNASRTLTAFALDTGVASTVWAFSGRKLAVDTGIADQVWKTGTAAYADDTGTFGELLRVASSSSIDTGQVNQAVWQANASRGITSISDTGVNSRLTAIQTKTDSLTFTVAGNVDANIQRVNDVAVGGTGASGDEWGPA